MGFDSGTVNVFGWLGAFCWGKSNHECELYIFWSPQNKIVLMTISGFVLTFVTFHLSTMPFEHPRQLIVHGLLND